jgi:hypothetical protein
MYIHDPIIHLGTPSSSQLHREVPTTPSFLHKNTVVTTPEYMNPNLENAQTPDNLQPPKHTKHDAITIIPPSSALLILRNTKAYLKQQLRRMEK